MVDSGAKPGDTMSTISQIRVEMHEKTGRKGRFFVGNINLPANIDLDNLIVFFYPSGDSDNGVAEMLIEKYKEKNGDKDNSSTNPSQSRDARK
jgi:hypothetical protein